MTSPDDYTRPWRKRAQIKKLEAMAKEQDEKHEARMDELAAEAFRTMVEIEMARLGPARDALAAQTALLAGRLQDVLGDDYGVSGDLAAAGFLADPYGTGEIVVMITIADRVFSFGPNDSLLAWRGQGGTLEYATLDENGEPGSWSRA